MQVVFRVEGYPPGLIARAERCLYSYIDRATIVDFTVELLQTVQKVTRTFMSVDGKQDGSTVGPHLHIFLTYCCFYDRPQRTSSSDSGYPHTTLPTTSNTSTMRATVGGKHPMRNH